MYIYSCVFPTVVRPVFRNRVSYLFASSLLKISAFSRHFYRAWSVSCQHGTTQIIFNNNTINTNTIQHILIPIVSYTNTIQYQCFPIQKLTQILILSKQILSNTSHCQCYPTWILYNTIHTNTIRCEYFPIQMPFNLTLFDANTSICTIVWWRQ